MATDSSFKVHYPGLKETKAIYAGLRTNELMSVSIGVVSAIAIILILKKIIDVYRSAYSDKTRHPDIKAFLDLIYEYAFYLLIILALPYIIQAVESVLGSLEAKGLALLGDSPKEGLEVAARDATEFQKTYKEGISWLDPIPAVFNYILCFLINPAISLVYSYMYSVCALTRYMYLLMLEIAAPIAVICLLSKRTEQHFYTWAKNMLVCYLMLPMFMLAIAFGTAAGSAAILGGYKFDIFSMFFQILIQLALIRFGALKLSHLL